MAIITIFFLFYGNVIKIDNTDPLVKPIALFVQQCIKDSGEDAIIQIGKNGGYVFSPNLSTKDNNPYYLYDETDYTPSKEVIEKQLSYYIEENLDFCINDFIQFKDFEINASEINAKTNIADNVVYFEVNYPLSIKKGERTYEFTKFESEVRVRLGKIYSAISSYMSEQMKYPKEVCLSCIHSFALEKDLYVELKDYDSKTILFTIIDQKTKLKGKEYSFVFANAYDIAENEIV